MTDVALFSNVDFKKTMMLSKEMLITALVIGAIAGMSLLLFYEVKAALSTPDGDRDVAATAQDDISNDGPIVGQTAPDFTLTDLTGQKRSLSFFRGHSVVLGFFCGCQRCHAAAVRIAAMQKCGQLKKIVAVVAMEPQGAASFQRSTGLQATVLVDPSDQATDQYSSDFCPRLWIISERGRIEYRSSSALKNEQLSAALNALMGQSIDGVNGGIE